MAGSPTVEATDVHKRYGDTIALRGVSLSVAPGEVFALVGPNGAGKTSLVRCLTGTTAIDDGIVELLGMNPREADTERIGLLPQNFDPPGRLTARELLAYYAGLYDEARSVETLLESVGIEAVAGTRFEDLSGGEQRRTLVGAAIANDPDVLFLDEPTTGIDPAGRHDVWALIDDLAAGGTTVVLTTHYMAEVDRLADRVGVLTDGDLVAMDTPESLVATYGDQPEVVVSTDATDVPGYDAERTERGLRVRGVDPGELGTLVTTLQDAEISFDALTWHEPDLESVYLSLTSDQKADRAISGGGQS